jgi:hypothetical protein
MMLKTTAENNPGKETAKETDVKRLQSTVEDMDALSQCGFSEIEAIAKLAEEWLKTPDNHRHLGTVSAALRTIWGKAQEIQDCISGQAEDVGCHYVPEEVEGRVMEALQK